MTESLNSTYLAEYRQLISCDDLSPKLAQRVRGKKLNQLRALIESGERERDLSSTSPGLRREYDERLAAARAVLAEAEEVSR